MKRFGLVGFQLGHSFSKKYFTDKFSREGLADYSYENFELKDISEFQSLIQNNPGICGLNVTIPFKEEVLKFLHEKSDTVKACRACNCIRIIDGKLTGHNTDVIGFSKAVSEKLLPADKKALVLGTGGGSKAVKYALSKLGIDVTLVSRSPVTTGAITYSDLSAHVMGAHTLIVNTTPVGTFPNINETPPLPFEYITPSHFLFDLVYNPPKTQFLDMGESRGARTENGLLMLEFQAEESWRIWNEN